MHRFATPACCRYDAFCLSRIPRRVGERPQYGLAPDHFTGWGLYFQETYNLTRLCICGIFAFLVSLAFGIAWATNTGSFQDAFAVASYVLALEALLVGLVQVAIGLS
jgi:hypothetical protein